MDNKVLDDIKNYAKIKLQSAYGTVGIAEGKDMAHLHSFLGEKTIKIKIEVVED